MKGKLKLAIVIIRAFNAVFMNNIITVKCFRNIYTNRPPFIQL